VRFALLLIAGLGAPRTRAPLFVEKVGQNSARTLRSLLRVTGHQGGRKDADLAVIPAKAGIQRLGLGVNVGCG
jgi:hypothetical protein